MIIYLHTYNDENEREVSLEELKKELVNTNKSMFELIELVEIDKQGNMHFETNTC